MSKKQIIIIVSVIVLIALAVWAYFQFFKKPKLIETQTPVNPLNSNVPVFASFPLQIGSVGENVKQLQAAINQIDSRAKLDLDGKFGKMTKDSLQAFVGGSYYPVTKEKFDYIIKSAKDF